MSSSPPKIFSKTRKRARHDRAAHMLGTQDTQNNAAFLIEVMADDIHDRLAFVRHPGGAVLIEGFDAGGVAQGPWRVDARFSGTGQLDLDTPLPFEAGQFDLVVSINSLDSVNDLPGALIQMRTLLKPGGLAIATFIGGSSLPKLRRAMLEAEPDRPAARMHPLIDPRSCPALLARAGWSDPVVDSHTLTARYGSLERLVADLREQAMTGVLASEPPSLGRDGFDRARKAFMAQADEDGRVSETFEIITLTGRRSLAGT